MQLIPFKKRILYYLTLFPLGLVMAFVFSAAAIAISGNKVYMGISIPVVFFVLHYVFGAILLKTKLTFKIIIPIITALVSGGILLLMMQYEFYLQTRLLDYYGYFDLIIQVFLVIVIAWEIIYQILKIVTNHRSDS